jgi:hypothetical protein
MKILADAQNSGVSWKLRRMLKIPASHENSGGARHPQCKPVYVTLVQWFCSFLTPNLTLSLAAPFVPPFLEALGLIGP